MKVQWAKIGIYLFLGMFSSAQASDAIIGIISNRQHQDRCVYELASGDVVEVINGTVDNIIDDHLIGSPAENPNDWQLGDQVERVVLETRGWVQLYENGGAWKTYQEPVLVNRNLDNAYLRINRYAYSPLINWNRDVLIEIGNGVIRTKTGILMIPHSTLKLVHWKAGDEIRYKEETGKTYGRNWTLYNETLREYAHPFWSIPEDPCYASYRVLSIKTKGNMISIELDYGLKLKVAANESPNFKVGDFATLQVKKSGLVLVHPFTREEVYTRSEREIPGLTGLSIRTSDGTLTMNNHPFRWKVENPKDIKVLKSWDLYNTVVIALNQKGDGYVLLNGQELNEHAMIYGSFKNDTYQMVPICHPTMTQDTYPDAYEGNLPRAFK